MLAEFAQGKRKAILQTDGPIYCQITKSKLRSWDTSSVTYQSNIFAEYYLVLPTGQAPKSPRRRPKQEDRQNAKVVPVLLITTQGDGRVAKKKEQYRPCRANEPSLLVYFVNDQNRNNCPSVTPCLECKWAKINPTMGDDEGGQK